MDGPGYPGKGIFLKSLLTIVSNHCLSCTKCSIRGYKIKTRIGRLCLLKKTQSQREVVLYLLLWMTCSNTTSTFLYYMFGVNRVLDHVCPSVFLSSVIIIIVKRRGQ